MKVISLSILLVGALTLNINAGPLPDTIQDQIFHYHLDGGAGTNVIDASDKGLPCTIGGTVPPVWVTGLFGNGLYFAGGTCITAANALLNVSSFTIAAWVKPDKTLAALGDRGMSVAAQWSIGYASFYSLRLEYGFVETDVVGDTPQGCIGTVRVSTGVWSHIAVVRRAGYNRRDIYVNGVFDTSCPTRPFKVGGSDAFTLGNDPNGANMDYFGAMDEVVFLSRAATDGEIASWYATGLGRHSQ